MNKITLTALLMFNIAYAQNNSIALDNDSLVFSSTNNTDRIEVYHDKNLDHIITSNPKKVSVIEKDSTVYTFFSDGRILKTERYFPAPGANITRSSSEIANDPEWIIRPIDNINKNSRLYEFFSSKTLDDVNLSLSSTEPKEILIYEKIKAYVKKVKDKIIK